MSLKRVVAAASASAVLMGVSMVSAEAASASYCNRSTCDLASGPSTGQIYFQMPSGTGMSMICWADAQWYLGTNRWFKVSTIYGTGYTSANEVGGQTSVGHC